MKERGILMQAGNVRAIQADRKTHTRRIVKLPHSNPLGQWESTIIGGPNGGATREDETIPEQGAIWHTRTGETIACPYGQPGDGLWVREAWRTSPLLDRMSPAEMPVHPEIPPVRYEADGAYSGFGFDPGRYRHARFMPYWASRIDLEITEIRVERLQEISEGDAEAEGIEPPRCEKCGYTHLDCFVNMDHYRCGAKAPGSAVGLYRNLWESINGVGSWNANPWVWVIIFQRLP